MIDERFAASIAAWLRRSDRQPRDPSGNVGRAMAQIRADRQRRRWLRFLPGPRPTAEADDGWDQSRSTDHITGGPMPAPTGGTRMMFSATKLAGLVAAIALFSALLLAGPVSPPSDDTAPAAPVAEHGEVTHFSGVSRSLEAEDSGQEPVSTRHPWGEEVLGALVTLGIESDDQRYRGIYSGYHNVDVVQPGSNWLSSSNGRLFTDDGSWHIEGRAYKDPETGATIAQEYAVGEGAHEGLYALTTYMQKPGSSTVNFDGVIFEGSLPETPEMAPDEPPTIVGDQ